MGDLWMSRVMRIHKRQSRLEHAYTRIQHYGKGELDICEAISPIKLSLSIYRVRSLLRHPYQK